MKNTLLIIIVVILCIGGVGFLLEKNNEPNIQSFLAFEAKNGFDIFFDQNANKELREYYKTGTVVINGSYFATTQSGKYAPAGLWNVRGNEYYNEKVNQDDPNLSRIALYDHAGGMVLFLDVNESLPECTKRDTKISQPQNSLECSTFQAGPLVLSGGRITDVSKSWHALEPHERTLLGTTEEGKIYFFIFQDKVTLKEAAENIQFHFHDEIQNLLNLDGGPSTAYFDGKKGFGQMKKLPIILRINIE